MRIINKIKIFSNNNDKSIKITKIVKELVSKYNFILEEENYDLAVAIGGDGSFLRMVKQTNFDSDVYYVGINAGTLGFLQEIKPDEIEDFFIKINNNEFKKDEIGIQETKIKTTDGISNFYSLNEIVIRDKNLKTTKLNIMIDDTLLEKFVGDGILISTSVGSTAYNLSFGGSIVYNTFHTLQITPIAPLNSKSYRDLLNSLIIPDSKLIKVIPGKDNRKIIVTIDGENNIYDDVESIETVVGIKRIKCLRLNSYNFLKIVNEKFLD